jgi:carboxypeptidase C (cathepsin A)
MMLMILVFLWPGNLISTTAAVGNYSAEALQDLISWDTLPGAHRIKNAGHLTYRFFAGYVELNPGNFYYYWFFESQNDPINDPLVLWLNGGPGCAGESQSLEDNGPFRLDKHLTFYPNPYSLTKIANVLYVDQPTGTGFSYSENSADYQITDTLAAQNVYTFLQGWFKRFSNFQTNDFKIATQSYGGHFGAFVSYEIVTRQANLADGDVRINFKGTAVGNPVADLHETIVTKIDKLWGEQVIPLPWYQDWQPICSTKTLRMQNAAWCSNHESFIKSLLGIDDPFGWSYPFSTSFPVCDAVVDAANTYHNRMNLYKLQESNALPPHILMMPCSYSAAYLNNATVMSLLNARFGGFTTNWSFCGGKPDGMVYSTQDKYTPIQSIYSILVQNYNLPILVFSGTDDGECPTKSTQDWVYSLNLTVANAWRTWSANASGFSYSGFFVQFNYNLTFVTLRNAGHIVSNFQPQAALAMMQKFLDGTWFNAQFVGSPQPANATFPVPVPASKDRTSSARLKHYGGGSMAIVFFAGLIAGLFITSLYYKCFVIRKGPNSSWMRMDAITSQADVDIPDNKDEPQGGNEMLEDVGVTEKREDPPVGDEKLQVGRERTNSGDLPPNNDDDTTRSI